MYATVMEVPLKSVACSVKAPCDLRGLVGLDDNAVGLKKVCSSCLFAIVDDSQTSMLSQIDATITIDSEGSDEQLEALHQAVDAHCPLFATFANKLKATKLVTRSACGTGCDMHVGWEVTTELKKVDSGTAAKEDGVKPEMVMGVIAAGKEDER